MREIDSTPNAVHVSEDWEPLACPDCRTAYGLTGNLHHGRVIVCDRTKEDGPGIVATIDGIATARREAKEADFIGRRNHIEVDFFCECGSRLVLQIMQHKGETLLRWTRAR